MSDTSINDFFGFLEDDGLEIPGVKSTTYPDGKTYIIPSPNAEMGMRLAAIAELGSKASQGVEMNERDMQRLQMDDKEERAFTEQILGDTYQQLIDDGVSWVRIQRITQYAFTYFAFSPETARKAAESGAFSGKAPALNREARRAGAKTGEAPKAPQASTGSRVN